MTTFEAISKGQPSLLTGSGLISSTLSVFTYWEYFTFLKRISARNVFGAGVAVLLRQSLSGRAPQKTNPIVRTSFFISKSRRGNISKIYIFLRYIHHICKTFFKQSIALISWSNSKRFQRASRLESGQIFERKRKSLSHIHIVPAFALSDCRRFIWQRDVTDVIFDALFMICHIQSMESCCRRRQCYIVITWLGLWLWYRDHKTEKSST